MQSTTTALATHCRVTRIKEEKLESQFTSDMGFTLALSRVLVATENSACWGADDANVTAVTVDAAVRIWGFQTVPTRQAVGTLTTYYCNLTLTLTSNLEVRKTQKKRETDVQIKKLNKKNI